MSDVDSNCPKSIAVLVEKLALPRPLFFPVVRLLCPVWREATTRIRRKLEELLWLLHLPDW